MTLFQIFLYNRQGLLLYSYGKQDDGSTSNGHNVDEDVSFENSGRWDNMLK